MNLFKFYLKNNNLNKSIFVNKSIFGNKNLNKLRQWCCLSFYDFNNEIDYLFVSVENVNAVVNFLISLKIKWLLVFTKFVRLN